MQSTENAELRANPKNKIKINKKGGSIDMHSVDKLIKISD